MGERLPKDPESDSLANGWDAALHQQVELEAETVHATAEFRRRVEALFINNLSTNHPLLWLYFRLPAKPAPGYIWPCNLNREILIIRTRPNNHTRPNLRIITNELFGTQENGSYLTEDFTLSHDNNKTAFLIDARDIIDGVPQSKSLSTLFEAHGDNSISFMYLSDAAPSISINAARCGGSQDQAFSIENDPHDKLDALNYGLQLIAEVESKQPFYTGAEA